MRREAQLVLMTRLGFAARGFLYLLIAWLLIGTGRAEDLNGALGYLATGSERVLLFAVAAGFVAYGIWRLADAALDTDASGSPVKGLAGRAARLLSGIVHLFLAWQAWRLFSGSAKAADGGAQQQASAVLDLPGGWLLLGVGAAVLLAAGIWQMAKAAKCSFLDKLKGSIRRQEWVRWLGRIGYGARGLIFLVTAYFFAQASLNGSAAEAGGMEEALRWLDSPVNLIVGAGLALFGLFSLIEARFREIAVPELDAITGRAASSF